MNPNSLLKWENRSVEAILLLVKIQATEKKGKDVSINFQNCPIKNKSTTHSLFPI